MASPLLDLGECLSVVLVDWDDTLLPTSDLKADATLSTPAACCPSGHTFRCFVNGSGQPPCFCDSCGAKPARGAKMFGCRLCNYDSCIRCAHRAGREALSTIDDRAATILESMCVMPNSHVTLLTNASLEWLWNSAEAFLPKVHRIFSSKRLSVVSARSAQPPLSTDCPFEGSGQAPANCKSSVASWKAQAVSDIAVDVQRAIEQQQPNRLQVLSIGDMPHDIEAGHRLASLLAGCCAQDVLVKTVLMEQAPSVARLAEELRALCDTLPSIVSHSEDMASCMSTGPCAL